MPRTIRHVLSTTVNAGHSGHGGDALVFDFPEDLPALQPYMVRHNLEFDPAWLQYTTYLTPIKNLIGGMNVGQPLFALNGKPEFTIMARQPGQSLLAWKEAEFKKLKQQGAEGNEVLYRSEMAFCDLMAEFTKRKENPFIKIFDETYRLGLLGYVRDCADGNLFVDTQTHTLGLVDQITNRESPSVALAQTNVQKFIKDLSLTPLTKFKIRCFDVDFLKSWDEHHSTMERLLQEARDKVLEMHGQDNAAPPIAFAKVESVHAIALDSPPHVLAEQLKQLTEQAQIPTR